MFANNNGIKIHYTVAGEGKPLILQHGTGGSAELWSELGYVDALLTSYKLILIDARGHGKSDKPHEPCRYSLRDRATDVVAVLDDLKIEKAGYIGYSMGGWIGYGLAAYFQHRFKVFLIGGAQPYESSDLVSSLVPLLKNDMNDFISLVEEHINLSPAYRKRLLSSDHKALIAALTIPRPNLSHILPNIGIPTLLYVGNSDPICPQVAQAAEAIPNAVFKSLDGKSHTDMFFEPHLALPILIDFLKKHY